MREVIIQDEVINQSPLQYQEIPNIKYCIECGTQVSSNIEKCTFCGEDNFLNGRIASIIGGYVKLSELGLLKKYYREKYKARLHDSIVKMNDQRIVFWIVVNEGLAKYNDRDTEKIIQKIIQRIFWKRY